MQRRNQCNCDPWTVLLFTDWTQLHAYIGNRRGNAIHWFGLLVNEYSLHWQGFLEMWDLPVSILPVSYSLGLSEVELYCTKGWLLNRLSQIRLRQSFFRKRRTYPMLFTTGRLRRCCFPSNEADTAKQQQCHYFITHTCLTVSLVGVRAHSAVWGKHALHMKTEGQWLEGSSLSAIQFPTIYNHTTGYFTWTFGQLSAQSVALFNIFNSQIQCGLMKTT